MSEIEIELSKEMKGILRETDKQILGEKIDLRKAEIKLIESLIDVLVHQGNIEDLEG